MKRYFFLKNKNEKYDLLLTNEKNNLKVFIY